MKTAFGMSDTTDMAASAFDMADALEAIGLYAEDCTGDYSGVYEVSDAND